MRIHILTLFPEMCEGVLSESIIGRARKAGLVEIDCVNIRDFTKDRHGRVDDTPYGGGAGMIMQAQPIYDCYRSVCEKEKGKCRLVYLTPQGKTLTQEKVKELSGCESIALLCGHYEGIDERVIDEIADEEISIGDYVLTGGELPALVLCDGICRLLPGVLSSEEAFIRESHFEGLLEYPQYTRPPLWRGRSVPQVLLSGHHAKIEEWRKEQALRITEQKRPDLLEKFSAKK